MYSIKHIFIIPLALSLFACGTPAIKPLTSNQNTFASTEAEQELLGDANSMHLEFIKKGMLYEDTVLNHYLNSLGQTLIPSTPLKNVTFRFHVLRTPMVNAMASPKGDIYLTVGLLSRLENEAQLAFVIAHEIAHVIRRHSYQKTESDSKKVVAAHITDTMLLSTGLGYIPYALSMANYSREQEQEADKDALFMLSKQGYKLQEVFTLYDSLMEIKNPKAAKESVYSSHPSNAKRQTEIKQLIQTEKLTMNPTGIINQQTYQGHKKRIIFENIKLKLLAKQYELTQDIIKELLKTDPNNPLLHYYQGEAYRMMAKDPYGAAIEHGWIYGKKNFNIIKHKFIKKEKEHIKLAEQQFHKSLENDKTFANAYRSLGLLACEQNKHKKCIDYLDQYLVIEKNPFDARYIKSLIEKHGSHND